MNTQDYNAHKFRKSLQIASIWLLVIWSIHLIQWFTSLDFTHYGILPHQIKGLKGIFFSPFLHSQKSWSHIINNSTSLFAGIILLYYFYETVAHRALLFIYLFSGLSLWCVAGYFVEAKYAFHIGASGVVYGLISFIFWSGLFRKNIRAIILSLITILMYSGMVVGLFPDAKGEVSWQGHVLGAIIGMILAYQYRHVIEQDEIQAPYSYEKEASNKDTQSYLAKDTFEKTKQERAYEAWLQRDNNQWESDQTW